MNILKKYKKHKKISNISIVAISLVVAVWINFLFFNTSTILPNLKANILQNEINKNIWDIYLTKYNNDIFLKTSNNIDNIESLSLSLIYNPENLKIIEIIPRLNAETLKISNTPGISTIILNYKEVSNIKAWERIFTIKVEKKDNIKESLNIINSNFTDSNNNTFELTSSSVSF